MKHLLLIAACSIATSIGSFAVAESHADLSVEEMADKFKSQLAGQKTRGLSIATAVTQNNSGGADVVPSVLPSDQQVNINIAFDFNSAAIRNDQKPKLVALCNALESAGVEKVRIMGHTDSSGSAAYNAQLSKLRAEEVKRQMISDCAFAPENLEAIGAGEESLLDPNNPRADINRRVEFQALS